MSEEITQSSAAPMEEKQETTLRPQHLEDFYRTEDGQREFEDLYRGGEAARGAPITCSFYGPPGLGKTTLASIIANELGVDIKITSGPAIERAGDLAAILTNLNENDVLFIDENPQAEPFRRRGSFILPWRILPWTSSSAKGLRPDRFDWTSPNLL